MFLAGAGFLFPPAAVLLVCFEASSRKFRSGWPMSKMIPDEAAGRICAKFAYAWGARKLGATAFAMMFVTATLATVQHGKSEDFPAPALTAMLLGMGGSCMAAVLTAVGLVQA